MTFFVWVCWDDHVVFILFFVVVSIVYHIDWFVNIEPSLLPGIKPTRLWYMILFLYYWIQFANTLLRIFASIFILTCNFLFCSVFVWFWYQGNGGLIEWIWECSVLFNFFGIIWKGYMLALLYMFGTLIMILNNFPLKGSSAPWRKCWFQVWDRKHINDLDNQLVVPESENTSRITTEKIRSQL